MRDPSERRILAGAKPQALRRLARFLGVRHRACDCPQCLSALVEACARRMGQPEPAVQGSMPVV
jgi:hypothetical protein